MMFGGEIPYKEMYESDPKVAAIASVSFTYVFVLFCEFFGIAIIVNAYIKIKDENFLLSRAMALIIWKNFKNKL